MTYDAAGVKLLSTTRQSTDPDTSATGVAKTTFEYDSSQPGLVSYITPPRGNTGSSSDHADATHFTYYGASDPSSKRGLLKSVNDPPGNTTTFDHDAERATDYIDDGLGRVRTETQYPSWPSTASPLVMTTTYDPIGNRATVTDQLGRTTTYAYDRINRLTGIDFSDAGTPDVTFTYDANGNRAMMVDGTGTTSYSYDELNRLLAVTSPASPSSTRRSATATTATATG